MEQRFSKITDKLLQKGYNLYPYNTDTHIKTGTCCYLMWSTHHRTEHKHYYLMLIPYQDFNAKVLEAIRDHKYLGANLYEIDEQYVTYIYREGLDPISVNQLVYQCLQKSKKKSALDTQTKIFSRINLASEAPKVKKSSHNVARVMQISDQLSRKGYCIYPYSEEQEIKITSHVALIIGTQEKDPQQQLLIVIPHNKLTEAMLQSVKNLCFKHPIKRLHDLDHEYLMFYQHALLTAASIDSMLMQLRDLHNADFSTTRRKIITKRYMPQQTREQPAIDVSFSVEELERKEINGYTVCKKLGVGGFGIVYLVAKNRCWYVMKIAKSNTASKSIQDEIAALKYLNNILADPEYKTVPKCVPGLYDDGYISSLPYFIEEFVVPLDAIKFIIYKNSKLSRFDPLAIIKDYYQQQAKQVSSAYEREKFLNTIDIADRLLRKENRPLPIDPLVASHIITQMAFLIYIMNINNLHYGDLKSENIGLRFSNMNIISPQRVARANLLYDIFRPDIIAEQLIVNDQPNFCAVLLDFGSLSRYKREGHTEVYFTPRYMVPNELSMTGEKVKKSFYKDPYTLGLVFLNMVSGLEPFWDVQLPGSNKQSIDAVSSLHESGQLPFDFNLVAKLIYPNLFDIASSTNSNLLEFISHYSNSLLGKVFKEAMVSIIANMQKDLSVYNHETPSRYQTLLRTSEHDVLANLGR